MANRPKTLITQCHPGVATGAVLTDWQFGASRHGYALPSQVQRLAREELTPCEIAVFDLVLNSISDIAQTQLCNLVSTKLVASRTLISKAAQNLAQQGKIVRKKIGGCWYYAKPGFKWTRT